ncbi:MAG: hypothetical protein ACE366_00695 [Bradymonadia bacterium]
MAIMPRVVLVTRPSDYERLVAQHGTAQAAEFFLKSRGQSLKAVMEAYWSQLGAVKRILNAIPLSWRRSKVDRADLDRFLFEPDDTVVVVGQDGLVANVAKYLEGQSVIGVNPSPDRFDGVLVAHGPREAEKMLEPVVRGELLPTERTMVQVDLDGGPEKGGQRLVALNELFIGHRSHQSSRYEITWGAHSEAHSSSGLIVATGTGATGWARSICGQRSCPPLLPEPSDPWLAFMVREPFPSVATGTSITGGRVDGVMPLSIRSNFNEGGRIFGDGIEEDHLDFGWGQVAEIGVAKQRLALVG